jgi:hypothetical protein
MRSSGISVLRDRLGAIDELTVLLDRAIEVQPSLAHQAAFQLADQNVQLPPGGSPRLAARPREPVPRFGKRDEVRAPATAVRRQHRAHAALTIDVRAHDDPLGARDPLEHRFARSHRQAVDRQTQIFDRPTGVMMTICHRLLRLSAFFCPRQMRAPA